MLIELTDDLQIGGQYPQLGGGAQLQFAAFVDIEGLIRIVGLHPDLETFIGFFKQGEAVTHIGRFLGGEQPFTKQSHLAGKLRIGKLFQIAGHLLLQRVIKGATGGQIQSVQIIKRDVEQLSQPSSGHITGLVAIDPGYG